MSQNSIVLGIDLGTSHSALAWWQQGNDEVHILDIPQLHSPGKIEKKQVLASATYIPHDGELSVDSAKLPWEPQGQPDKVHGSWARARGQELPDRYINSAKSWLCSNSIDRKGAILPWQSDISNKISPVEALSAYLTHLREAFLHEVTESESGAAPRIAEVVLTVPASFDEVARNLTREAAAAAGFDNVQLLEEPQAAFYSWIASNEKKWRDQVASGDLVLVCDVGGGTTDFSLIAVHEEGGELSLGRISVGNHLLLGGDNMDLALAWYVSQQLEKSGKKPDKWQFRSLTSAVRTAKEKLLSDPDLQEFPVSVASRGSGLMAGSLSFSLKRSDVEDLIVAGFVPKTGQDDLPASGGSMGFQELGLHYETEPAISKHLAAFLSRSRQNVESDEKLRALIGRNSPENSLLLPTAVLFNGGVFKSSALKNRILELLNSWSPDGEIRELEGGELDLAVAHGAAYLGRSRLSGHGIRIASGIARSYYLGLETVMMAVPGVEPEVKGLCVVAQGTEEGSSIELPEKQFGLITGQKVSFRFFSSPSRAGDKVGSLISDAPDVLEETSRLELTIPPMEGSKVGAQVPVNLAASISDMGILQLSLQHVHSDKKWDLEFSVRPRF